MAWISILDTIYPVGSVFMTTLDISPAETIGGQWTPITEAVLRATESNIGSYSGSDMHTMTVDQMPNHNHNLYNGYGDNVSGLQVLYWINRPSLGNTAWYNTTFIGSAGSGNAFSVLPRTYNVYCWVRTA